MVRFNFLIILICSLFLFQSQSLAEDTEFSNSTFGIFANYGLNMHTADFNMLKDIPNCCPDFESGSGTEIGLGLLYEYRLESKFSLGMRLGLTNLSGELSSIEQTTVMIDNAYGDGEFEHIMNGKFTVVGLTPMLIYNATERLKIHAGFKYNFVLTSTFDQVEKIKTPENKGTFVDENGEDTHLRTRNEYSGEIPEAKSSSMAVSLGVGYEFPLNKKNTLRLTPEVFYNYGLSEMVSETSWKIARLEGGFSIKYVPEKSEDKPERIKEIYQIDTVKIGNGQYLARVVRGKDLISTKQEEKDNEIINYQYVSRMDTAIYQTENPNAFQKDIAEGSKDPSSYKIKTSVDLFALEEDGTKSDTPTFIVEEFVSHKINPLLKYIFFEENSSQLDKKYVQLAANEIDKFYIDSLFKYDIIDIYYNILNVIGQRLQKHTNADLTLTGCNADFGSEENNTQLSRKRAESIKEYLTTVWNIKPNRIKIETRNLPKYASLPKDENDKAEENRRVEINSNMPEIVEYLSINNIERKVNPPKAIIELDIEAEAEIANWKLTAKQSGTDREFTKEGSGTPPKEIIWNFELTPSTTPTQPKEVLVRLEATDVHGNSDVSEHLTKPLSIISVDQKQTEGVEDYKIDKYRLILFDFNKSDVSGENKEIVNQIKKNISPESSVLVKGHTDRTGNDAYNKKLSLRRAESVKNSLAHPNSVAVGKGEEDLLYDNDSPESRFYCRTVVVEVKTKK